MREINHSFQNLELMKERARNRIEYLTINFDGFNNFTDEDRKKAKEIASKININESALENQKYYYMIFALTTIENKKKYNVQEILSILIEAIDPNLRLLKISMTSNTDFEIEKKANRLFGFYDPNLIDFEREYARRFYKKNRNEKAKKLEQ